MCHKYALDVWSEYIRQLRTLFDDDIPVRPEIFPGQKSVIFSGSGDPEIRELLSRSGEGTGIWEEQLVFEAHWGLLPRWSKSSKTTYSTYNARSESADTSPAFRGPFRQSPCLVPASGFFEYSGSGKSRIPHFFTYKNRDSFCFAGLYDVWFPPAQNHSGEKPRISFTILTVEPNDLVGSVHNRMPVILPPGQEKLWLTDLSVPERKKLCRPLPSELMNHALQHRQDSDTVSEPDLFRSF